VEQEADHHLDQVVVEEEEQVVLDKTFQVQQLQAYQ
jgi:hypothetical protein